MNRFLILLLFALFSGATALSHELLWTRRLVDLMGGTEWVVGRVLGLFFLGLSIGGWIATRWMRSERSPFQTLALAELAIGILSLPVAFLSVWTDWIWSAIGIDGLIAWGATIKLAVAAVVILPPAIAMGTTLPFFIRSAIKLRARASGSSILMYTVNTLGGVLGLWVMSTTILETLGVQWSMLAMILMNWTLAAAIFLLGRTAEGVVAVPERSNKNASSSENAVQWSRNKLLFISFLSGLFVMALEILLLRLVGLVVPSSFQTTSAVLANVILFLALGSILTWVLKDRLLASKWILISGLLGAVFFIAIAPSLLYAQTQELISVRYLAAKENLVIDSLTTYWLVVFQLIAVVSGGALLFCGLVFPALLSINAQREPDGKSVGLLLAANGIGGLIGSEMVSHLLIPQFGIYIGFLVLSLVVTLTAVWLVWELDKRVLIVGLVVVVPFLVWRQTQVASLPYVSPKTTRQYVIEEQIFDPGGVVLVVEDQRKSRSIMVNNQYILGSTGVAVDEQRQLRLPWIFRPDAEKVCCIGLATGISASGLESLESPPSVTSVELSSHIVDVAREFFQTENESVLERKENRIVVEDGRIFAAAAVNEFDLIVADLFRPHGVGEGRLFSVEHYRNVKKALRPDGVFCQWLPAHQLNEANFEIIAATFQEVFPETLVVICNVQTKIPIIGLMGRKSGSWNPQEIRRRCNEARTENIFEDTLLKQAEYLVFGLLKKDAYSDVPLNTLDNALIEIAAGKFWITKDLRRERPADDLKTGFLSGENWLEFSTRLQDKVEPLLDEGFRRRYLEIIRLQLQGKSQR